MEYIAKVARVFFGIFLVYAGGSYLWRDVDPLIPFLCMGVGMLLCASVDSWKNG